MLAGLPCQNLRKLVLQDVLLGSTTAGSAQPGILSSCLKLTSLTLSKCRHPDCSIKPAVEEPELPQHSYGYPRRAAECLAALTGLTGLQHLSLKSDDWSRTLLPETLLVSFQKLASLELRSFESDISSAHLQHLTALSSLQELTLDRVGGRLSRWQASYGPYQQY